MNEQNEQLVDTIFASMEVDVKQLKQLKLESEQLNKLIEIKDGLESLILSYAIASDYHSIDIDEILAMIA